MFSIKTKRARKAMLCSYSNKHLSSKIRKKKKSGAALVEAALVFPVLILLVFGMIDCGLLLKSYLALGNVAREAARITAVGGTANVATGTSNLATDFGLKPSNFTKKSITSDVDNNRIVVDLQYRRDKFYLSFLPTSLESKMVMRIESR